MCSATCPASRIRSTTVRLPTSCLISARTSPRTKRRGKTLSRHRREFGNTHISGWQNVASATLTNGRCPFPFHQHQHSNYHGAFEASLDRKSTRLNSSHQIISYAVFCLKKKKTQAQDSSNTT